MNKEKFEEKIKYFEEKQKEMLAIDSLMKARATKAQEDLNKELTPMQQELEKKGALYRAEMKAWCGMADGERTNVLDMVKFVQKVLQGD